jgi:glycosyltransferase involved in cell wall biosynthesis
VNSTDGAVLLIHPGKQHAYEVAVALQKAGRLREFVTGVYFKPAAFPYSLVARLPSAVRHKALRALGKRTHPALSPQLVRSWPYAEILSRAVSRIGWVDTLSQGRCGYPFIDWASDFYMSHLLARMDPAPAAVFGFLGGSLRTFARARQLGIPTILDVPIVFDAAEILAAEYRRLGLRRRLKPPPSGRLRRELALADWVVAGSPAVAQSVARAGYAGREVFIVPYGVDASLFTPAPKPRNRGPFRVVFAGRLEVRKGVHYLLEAWRQAEIDGELVLAGPPGEEEFLARMRQQYGGMFREAGNLIQRDLAQLLASSDVFVFPSIAEGSALVTYQALASGLPCIVTPEAGSVVRDGVEGFVVPVRDSRAVAARLRLLHADSALREQMGRAAGQRGCQFTWDHYHATLANVLAEVQQ